MNRHMLYYIKDIESMDGCAYKSIQNRYRIAAFLKRPNIKSAIIP